MKKYYSYSVKKIINVKKLMAMDYIVVSKDFASPEESHAFYEFAYVDAGSLKCFSGEENTVLNQGDFFLIPPNTNHYYKYNGVEPTNVFVVCFDGSCDFFDLILGKATLNQTEKGIMSLIFSESRRTFKFPTIKKLTLLDSPAFGSQQMVENQIESLLINLVRAKLNDIPEIKFVMNSSDFNDKLVNDIMDVLKKNVYGKVSLEDIQKSLYYSKTYLNNNFKKITGASIMHYYRNLKIEEAKKLLKKGESVTTISDKLNFESPNYFSKVFRSVTGLTPSKYKRTI